MKQILRRYQVNNKDKQILTHFAKYIKYQTEFKLFLIKVRDRQGCTKFIFKEIYQHNVPLF